MALTPIIAAVVTVVMGYFWQNYFKRGPIYNSNKSLEGKTVLITGGNSGLGKTAAMELAKNGARIVIASRNLSKSVEAKEEIIKETGNKEVEAMKLDLSDFENVRNFAKLFEQSEPYLDILINNAGTMNISGTTDDGVNNIYAINHFGHFLLTNLLLDKMKAQSKSRPVRIVSVAGVIYRYGKISEESMRRNTQTTLEMMNVCCDSKLAIVYFISELHNRIKDYDITTYSVHPGSNKFEVPRGMPAIFKFLAEWVIMPLFMREKIYGVQTALYCALDDGATKYSGGYFTECEHQELSPLARDESVGKFVWEESLKITGLGK